MRASGFMVPTMILSGTSAWSKRTWLVLSAVPEAPSLNLLARMLHAATAYE